MTIALTGDGFARSVIARAADRFGRLNGVRPRVIMSKPDGAPDGVHPAFYKAWLWDMVPARVDRIMYIDFDVIPVRPLGEIPDCTFGACIGTTSMRIMSAHLPYIRRAQKYFNTGVFLAHRDTKPYFDQLKAFASTRETSMMRHMEQCTLNLLLQPAVKILTLPDEWNYQITIPNVTTVAEPKLIHASAYGNRRWSLLSFLLDRLDSAELGQSLGDLVGAEDING